MWSKLKRPAIILIMVLICVQVFQILYRDHVLEMIQFKETGTQGEQQNYINQRGVKNEPVHVVPENLKNDKKTTKKNLNKYAELYKEAAKEIRAKEASFQQNKKPELEQKKDEEVTDDVQARIAENIRNWKAGEAEKQKSLQKYDGHDLLKDPVFKFNSRFKNPCWYEGGRLLCLPYVFVIGVKKCGTSDLFYRLSLHPDFVKPGFKEAQWFARKRFKSNGMYDNIYEYVSMFRTAAAKIQDYANTSSDGQIFNYNHVTGEGSPSNLHLNMHWKRLPGNENLDEPKVVILDYIHHYLPKAKIIITFRDPVERLYSDYYHEYGSLMKTNKPNPRQFHKVVESGVKLYEDCFKRHSVRSCVYEPSLYQQTKIQIQLGIYYIFWEDLTRLYPREQILALQNKNLRDKENTMKSVYEFLKLRSLSKHEMTRVVTAEDHYQRSEKNTKKGPMLNETFDLLHSFYKPFNLKMVELTDDTDFLYTGE